MVDFGMAFQVLPAGNIIMMRIIYDGILLRFAHARQPHIAIDFHRYELNAFHLVFYSFCFDTGLFQKHKHALERTMSIPKSLCKQDG